MALHQFVSWLYAPYSHPTGAPFHRRLLVVSGGQEDCEKRIESLLQAAPHQISVTTLGRTGLSKALSAQTTRKHILGNECDLAVLYAHERFSPGDLIALAGTIRCSGCLILSCPPLAHWPAQSDPSYQSHGTALSQSYYLERLVNIVSRSAESTESAEVAIWESENHSTPPRPYSLPPRSVKVDKTSDNAPHPAEPFQSHDQERAFTQLTKIWQYPQSKAVITAPRGRGKSALVGLFVASRLELGANVFIASALRENTSNLFKHLSSSAPTLVEQTPTSFRHPSNGAQAEWLSLDNPRLLSANCDLLVIDEAASFPLPVLKRLLSVHAAWIISTTTDGYEGSGQGFAHKMRPFFTQKGAITLSLSTPLRWVEHDQLESLVNHICLFEPEHKDNLQLSAPDCPPASNKVAMNDTSYKIGTIATLNEAALNAVMHLLAIAHYQTTPDDFMRLMDSPDLHLVSQWQGNTLTGAAVINSEGGQHLKLLCEDIANGTRRPKGHLSAQRLTLLTAQPDTATFLYWRINRIAITPAYQQCGLGLQLLERVKLLAVEHKVDCVTSSYGQSDKLNQFWRKAGYHTVDKGLKPNKASGETSALVLLPLTDAFKRTFQHLCMLYDVEQRRTALPLSKLAPAIEETFTRRLQHFTEGNRALTQLTLPIASLAMELDAHAVHRYCRPPSSALLQVLKTRPLDTVKAKQLLGVVSSKQLSASLRELVCDMLMHYLTAKQRM